MIKIMAFFKKRPDMTMEEFQKQYEEGYTTLAKPHIPEAKRYFRRYVETMDVDHPASFDVMTEMWFDSEEDYKALFKRLHEGEIQQTLVAEQKKTFGDISPILVRVVKESD